MFHRSHPGFQPGSERRKRLPARSLFKGDQEIGQQQQAHLGAEQVQGIPGKAEPMQHHEQGPIQPIDPGALRHLQQGGQQHRRHLEHLQHGFHLPPIRQTHHPQPDRIPAPVELGELLAGFQRHQPRPFTLKQHGAEAAAASTPVHIQVGRQVGGALLEEVGIQSTRGGAQHGEGGGGASQRLSTWPPPTMLAWSSRHSTTWGNQPAEDWSMARLHSAT